VYGRRVGILRTTPEAFGAIEASAIRREIAYGASDLQYSNISKSSSRNAFFSCRTPTQLGIYWSCAAERQHAEVKGIAIVARTCLLDKGVTIGNAVAIFPNCQGDAIAISQSSASQFGCFYEAALSDDASPIMIEVGTDHCKNTGTAQESRSGLICARC
jgi:hypothetical protein